MKYFITGTRRGLGEALKLKMDWSMCEYIGRM